MGKGGKGGKGGSEEGGEGDNSYVTNFSSSCISSLPHMTFRYEQSGLESTQRKIAISHSNYFSNDAILKIKSSHSNHVFRHVRYSSVGMAYSYKPMVES